MTVAARSGRPTDQALWASMAETLRQMVLPAVDDAHTRQVVIQLIGLAVYAVDRGPDPTPRRAAEVAAALDRLVGAGHALVRARWDPGAASDPAVVFAAAGEVLAAAVASEDQDTSDVQRTLRSILVRHLRDDLAAEEVMLGAFRGRLPDG